MRKEKLDEIVVFADDSNMRNMMEVFDKLVGWHTFNLLRYTRKSVVYIDDRSSILPRKLEWSRFMLKSRLL